jgi:sugar lactone lactonase YvrE
VSLSLPGGALNTGFNGTGAVTLMNQFTNIPPGTPYGLAVDKFGNVYAAVSNGSLTAAGNTVQEFGLDGSPVIAVQGFNAPYGIAIDVNSSLYVADTNNHQSEEFLLNSYIVPTNIFGIGNLTSPKGIAVDPNLSNNIYITDSVLNEVFEFAQ